MDALDGNVIAGDLFEYFGAEMTTVSGSCAHCGARAQIAELRVFQRAPGAVARCAKCGNVVLVVVDAPNNLRIYLSGFQLPENEPMGSPRAD